REQIGKIVQNLLRDVQSRLADEQLTLKLADDAIDFLIEHGYDEKFGARPIKRAIQKYLEDPLSEKILRSAISADTEIAAGVTEDKEGLSFRVPSSSKT